MRKKEIKELAKKIAKYEHIIQTSNDSFEVNKAKDMIASLSGAVESIEDMVAVDELVQDLLQQST